MPQAPWSGQSRSAATVTALPPSAAWLSIALGNILVAGALVGAVDFGGGPITSLSPVVRDIYIASFDPAGTHLCSQRFGGTDIEDVYDVIYDASSGAFLISGQFASSTLDLGALPVPPTPVFAAGFVSKLAL